MRKESAIGFFSLIFLAGWNHIQNPTFRIALLFFLGAGLLFTNVHVDNSKNVEDQVKKEIKRRSSTT